MIKFGLGAVPKLDQVTKHLEFMMLSAKQEAICRALQNNEILIPLKKEEQSNVCLKAYAQRNGRNNLNSINVYTVYFFRTRTQLLDFYR